MKEQSSFREQTKFSQRILRSPMPNEHPDGVVVRWISTILHQNKNVYITLCDK